jgi:hypothetical protein
MPFNQLINAQQFEAVIAGPADTNRLYVCSGLAQGSFSVTLPAGAWMQSASDTWQFAVGPQLDSTQFRRAIGTASFAGLQETEAEAAGSTSWMIQMVIVDFDDDLGKARVSVTNTVQIYNAMAMATGMVPTGTGSSTAGVSTLAYDVSILAAMPE